MNVLADLATDPSWQSILTSLTSIVAIVLGAIAILNRATGKDVERQIEPTQIHALRESLDAHAKALTENNRELGVLNTSVETLTGNLTEMRGKQERDIGKVHNRIDGISDRVAAHEAKIGSLERIVSPR